VECQRLFDSLHSVPECVPQFLARYGTSKATAFFKLYDAAVKSVIHPIEGLRYYDPTTVLALRRVFDDFSKYLYDPKDDASRPVSASFRLYSHLPSYTRGSLGLHFYLAASLPTAQGLEATHNRWTQGWAVPGIGDSLVPVSFCQSGSSFPC
jgi:hypothetical protein